MKRIKKVLVTGGAGYIGSVLSEKLLSSGYRVVIYDRFYFGRKPISAIKGNRRLTVVRGDIRNTKKVASLLEPGMSVIHLASLSNDPSCDLNPGWSLQINHEAAVRLAESARLAGCVRFLYASSCSVYGYGQDKILKETSACDPVSLYARLKLKTETDILNLKSETFQPVMLRQATIFGLSPRMRFDLAINQMTMHAITKGKIFVLGGGRQWRPFLHVRDAVSAYLKVLEAKPDLVSGQLFNVGSTQNNFRIADLAKKVKREIKGVEIEVTPEDPDKRDYHVDFSKIRKKLGFRPKVAVPDGIREIASFIHKSPKRDYNSSDFFNIKRLMEHEKLPAKKGGEPVRAAMLTFKESFEAPAVPTAAKTDGKNTLDFVRAAEALVIVLQACGINRGNSVMHGRVCDSWLSRRLKNCGIKITIAETEPDSFALSGSFIKMNAGKKTKAVFFSEFDNAKTVRSIKDRFKIVFTSVPPDKAVIQSADITLWKAVAAPGISPAPAARVFVRNRAVWKKINKILRSHVEEWLETPIGGPALSEGFDKLAADYLKVSVSARRLKKAVAKSDSVTLPNHQSAGSFCLMFNVSKRAKEFSEWAAAENMESAPLPPGWEVANGGRVNGIKSAPYRRSAFLPMGPAMKDKDVTDVIRVLNKLLQRRVGL